MKKLAFTFAAIALVSCKQGNDDSASGVAETSAPQTQSGSPTAGEIPSHRGVPEKQPQFTLEQRQEIQCLQDLCGKASDLMATRAQGPFGTIMPEDVKSFIASDVNPSIFKAVRSTFNNLEESIHFVDRATAQLRADSITDEQFGFLVASTLTKQIFAYGNSVSEVRNGKLFILLDKLPPQLTSINPEFYRASVELINAIFASRAAVLNLSVGESFESYRYSVVARSADPKKAWLSHLNIKKSELNLISKDYGPYMFADLKNDELIKKALDEEVLTQREQNTLYTLLTRIILLKAFDEAEVKSASRNLNKDIQSWLKVINWQSQRNIFGDFLKNPKNEQLVVARMEGFCKEAVVQNLAASPSDFRLKRAELLLEGVKNAAKSAAQAYFKDDSLTKAQAVVDKIRFDKPKTESQTREEIKKDLLALVVSKDEFAEALENAQDDADLISLLSVALPSMVKPPEVSLFESAQKACDSIKPALFEDQARQEGDQYIIRLGWQTASFHQIGAGIMAHEIGHVVSKTADILKSAGQEYWKTRQCSSDIHKKLISAKGLQINASQYQEEDWADAFAITTMKILNKTWPYAENYACALTSLPDGQYGGNSLTNTSTTDVHATGIYRTLQVHLGMGKTMPESCQTFLGDQASTVSRSCAQ